VLPSVQNLSNSYAIQRQRHLDAQRLAFKDQQTKIHESLVEQSQSERIRSLDEENDDAAATASLENTSGVSSGSTGTSLTTLTDESDSKISMSEVRNLLKRQVSPGVALSSRPGLRVRVRFCAHSVPLACYTERHGSFGRHQTVTLAMPSSSMFYVTS
jgi:hypothetical protein